MARGLGAIGAVQSLPDAVVGLFALITQLGDAWFVFGVLSALYWFDGRFPGLAGAIDRRRAAFLLALVLGGLGLTSATKAFFGLPRPPGAGVPPRGTLYDALPPLVRPIYENFSTADGYGFPSGHAVRSTLAWGGLALTLDAGTPGRRYAAAGLAVAVVSVSRVVLGVHYAVDVLVGVVVGLVYLGVAWRLVGPANPTRAFSLALALALVGVLIGGFERDPLAVLGAAVGAWLTWRGLGGALLDVAPTRRAGAVAAVIGLPVLGGLFVVAAALDTHPAVTLLATAVALGGVLGLPLGVERLQDRLQYQARPGDGTQ